MIFWGTGPGLVLHSTVTIVSFIMDVEIKLISECHSFVELQVQTSPSPSVHCNSIDSLFMLLRARKLFLILLIKSSNVEFDGVVMYVFYKNIRLVKKTTLKSVYK